MSNNDDFDFNRDDLFDDFDDDDSGGDDFGGDEFGSDDFDFGDDSDDFNLDDDSFGDDLDTALSGDDDGGDDDDDFGTTANNQSGGGTSRGFIIAAVAMVILFLVGIGLIVFILMREDPETLAFNASATAISLTNEVALTQIAASATAAIDSATETQAAFIAGGTATEQAIIDATASYVPPSPTPTEDLTATAVEATNQVVQAQETTNAQFAIDATNTEVAFQLTLNPVTATPEGGIPTQEGGTGGVSTEVIPQGNTPVPLPAVQQTATALAQLFAASPTPSGGGVQATDIVGTGDGGTGGAATQIPNGTSNSGQGGGGDGQLPDTGLFDDVFQGNPAFIFLAAFGLLGVIVFSRTVRSRKNDE